MPLEPSLNKKLIVIQEKKKPIIKIMIFLTDVLGNTFWKGQSLATELVVALGYNFT